MSSPHRDSAQGLRRPLALSELGLTPEQAEILTGASSQRQGLVLFAGPRKSGKSRTLYSFLGELDLRERSLVSIEDRIEYSLPFARRREIDEESGDSLELLFIDVVDEDPEILLIGEIQNKVGAWASLKFAKKGRLAVSTLPSSNATTAIFRLDRMGIPRDLLGETLIAIVSQRLLNRLCPDCKEVRPITRDEGGLLAPFTSTPPEVVARPVGCPSCGDSGFHGKKAVFEVIKIGSVLAELIGEGISISEIRHHALSQGTPLLADGGIQGIRELDFPVQTVYEELLLEELDRTMGASLFSDGEPGHPALVHGAAAGKGTEQGGEPSPKVLVVEDDSGTRMLIERILLDAGFTVTSAEDGAAALFKLATDPPDLILSDIHMPNLDGMKLLELVHQHGIKAPVVMLTAEESREVEERSFELGAFDFLRKPIDKTLILESLGRALISERL